MIKTTVKQTLKDRDPMGFQQAFVETMNEKFNSIRQALQEEMADVEKEAVLKLEIGAKSFGAAYEDTTYDQGVLITIIRNKQAAGHFSDFLEDCPFVDSYEINVLIKDPTNNQESTIGVDFDDIQEGSNYDFEFVIYLDSNLVDYDYEEDYSGDLPAGNYDVMDEAVENIAEAKRTIRVNFRGVKRIKMKCGKGFKWNPTEKQCQKIGGQDLAIMRRSIRQALITKKNEGSSLRRRVIRKRKKALKYRKSYGL
jgi:hypothetical protein